MKKFLLLASLSIFAFGTTLTSCSSDPEYDSTEVLDVAEAQLPYDSDGIWLNNLKPGYYIEIDDYIFSHTVDSYGYAYGFTASKNTDTSRHEDLYEMPYTASAGKGVNGANSPYLVGYWAEYLEGPDCDFTDRTCRVYEEDGDTFKPESVMVCTNTLLQYAVMYGTAMTKPFTGGDFVTLVAHGVHMDGTEAQDVFYLVNDDDTDLASRIVTQWTKFDLSNLGACTGVYFTMDCSEAYKNDYGMLLPSYFCLGQMTVKD